MSKIENKKLVIAITLLSFLVQCTTMLSPTLLVFQKSFPDVSMTTIQSLLTLPSLISIPFFFLGGALSRTISTKKMLIVGVSIIAVGGLLPIFLHDFGAILVCRAIMGMGLGLMNPFAQSLVSDNFEDEGITLMFGIQAAATSAGNMIGCYASGYRCFGFFLCPGISVEAFRHGRCCWTDYHRCGDGVGADGFCHCLSMCF